MVIEGANDPIVPNYPEADQYLAEHGVTVIPDFVANSGTAGLFGVLMLGQDEDGNPFEMTADGFFEALETQIRRKVRELLERSKKDGITAREAAIRIAQKIKAGRTV